MVGEIRSEKFPAYAKALLPYFMDERTLFVVSSDFCHWGQDFEFTFRYPEEPIIHKSIEKLDRVGMSLIESQSRPAFEKYLIETENTICGQQPILMLLALVEAAK